MKNIDTLYSRNQEPADGKIISMHDWQLKKLIQQTVSETLACANLDNLTAKPTGMSEGETDMAKRIRQKVMIGGKLHWVTGETQQEVFENYLRKVQEAGYQGMLYALREEFEDPALWDASLLLEEFPVWIADYAEAAPPDAEYPETEYDYAMWQYSCTGRVSGIAGDVDRNVSYHPFEEQGAK